MDAAGNFSNPILIDIKTTSLGSLRSYDLDNDNDLDILVSYYYNGSYLAWFENLDGQGTFGPKQIINTAVQRATDASAADLNGDGILDIISASSFDDKIAWYEGGVLGIPEIIQSPLIIYPNPANNWVTVDINEPIKKVRFYNTVGQQLKTKLEGNKLNLAAMPSGLLFIQIEGESGRVITKRIVKE